MTLIKDPLHPDLRTIQDRVFDAHGFAWTAARPEAESADYAASSFEVNGLRARFRVANITPTKVGQFVTLWKRIGDGPIQPFDESDPVDLFVVSVRQGAQFGQFVFPKAALAGRDIVARAGQGGKRAIRVYPPWDATSSKQAQATQRWQLAYFLAIPEDRELDGARLRTLYGQAA